MPPTATLSPPAGPWRTEFSATMKLAWPLAAANLLQMLVHAVDVIFVARLGEQELAASSLAIALFGLILWGLSGLTGAVAPLIAAELGRRRHAVREVRRSVRMGLWLAVLVGALGMIACLGGERLMLLTGQDPKIAAMSGDFLQIIIWAMIPMVLSNVLRIFVSALDRPIFATMIIASAIGVSVLANWVLVFGNLGAPALGLEGSALASVFTSLFILAAYVAAIGWDRRLRRYRILGNWWRTEWGRMKDIIRIGTPIMFTIFAEAGLFSGAAFLMGRIGPSELAGHTIALQVAALAFQIPFGIGQAATIRVGYHFGAGDTAAIARAGWIALAIAVAFSMVTASIMLFAPLTVLSIYVDVNAAGNSAMVGFAVQYLLLAAIFQLVDAVQAVSAGNLRGLQDTRVPMVIAVFSYWAAGFSISIWLGLNSPLAGVGVWIGLAAGLLVAAILLTWRWAQRGRFGLV
ncbi:MATE family efflux transporter [Allopontixanthobacter sediminis]|uniref:MATE family efflux transporter n=1 Tax=Allopontixanthobacter sediminis TaxID=1689985 RepID=A0A845B5T4_9SPHN|nr:MATE family efflux transporter [Allopontixanthobacter sediminis]MXP44797.1 MATE family efflux transporter [Allopontixanthobacter sediminis]